MQAFFRILALVYRFVAVAVFVVAVVAVERNEINIHHRQSRHHEATQRANVNGRINRIEHRHDQVFQIRIADHDLRVASAPDHARVALSHGNDLHALFDVVCAAPRLVVLPLAQTINTIGEATMWLIVNTTRIETAKVLARLNQRRDATRHAITLRMAFAQLGGQQIRQLDLADLAFDFIVSHVRFEIVLETILAEKLDKQFLCQVCVGCATSFFDQQAGAA